MNNKKAIAFLLAIILIIICISFPLYALKDDKNYLDNLMTSKGVEKAQIVIIKDGQIAYTYSYGCEETEKFNVFAISKSVLGILAAKMQDDGVFDLDDEITPYWKKLESKSTSNCSEDWKSYYGNSQTVKEYASHNIVQNPATIRNCLTHSSTIKDGSMLWQNSVEHSGIYFGGSMSGNYGLALFMLAHTYSQLFNKMEDYGAPGTLTQYNPNEESLTREHALAGFTMQIATNVSLNEYLKREILDKIEVTNNPGFLKGNSMYYAVGYQTNAVDLAKIITVVLNDGMYGNTRILSTEAVQEIEKVETNLANQTIAFNYINGHYEKSGRIKSEHLGHYSLSQGNNYSYVSFDPKTKGGIVVNLTGKTESINSKEIFEAISNYAKENYIEVHAHSYSQATCTEPAKCSCGDIKKDKLGHLWNPDGICIRCGIK